MFNILFAATQKTEEAKTFFDYVILFFASILNFLLGIVPGVEKGLYQLLQDFGPLIARVGAFLIVFGIAGGFAIWGLFKAKVAFKEKTAMVKNKFRR